MTDELKELIIVDDHRLFRQSLKNLLRKKLPNLKIHEASGGKELLKLLEKKEHQPDIILLDLEMPEMDGLQVTQKLLSDNSDLSSRIIILTMHDDKSLIIDLIEKGVHGYILKDADISEILEAIHQVQSGKYYVSQHTFDAIREDTNINWRFKNKLNGHKGMLSHREEEILTLICKEYTNKEIAEHLNLSIRTVDGHRNRLLKKTGMKNTVGLVKYALRNGVYALS